MSEKSKFPNDLRGGMVEAWQAVVRRRQETSGAENGLSRAGDGLWACGGIRIRSGRIETSGQAAQCSTAVLPLV